MSATEGKSESRPIATSAVSLASCDQEPIHIPDAIQPHGAVLAARLDDLLVTHVSANLQGFSAFRLRPRLAAR